MSYYPPYYPPHTKPEEAAKEAEESIKRAALKRWRRRPILGELEYEILYTVHKHRVSEFAPSELQHQLGVPSKYIQHALRRLTRRLILAHDEWGFYRPLLDLEAILSHCIVTKRSPSLRKRRTASSQAPR